MKHITLIINIYVIFLYKYIIIIIIDFNNISLNYGSRFKINIIRLQLLIKLSFLICLLGLY